MQQRFLKAKRALFDRVFDHLNKEQRDAVYTVNGPLLILAGAGSGKTTVLVNRIGYMIRYGNAYLSERMPEWVSESDIAELENAIALPKEHAEALLDKYSEDKIRAWNILSITFTNKAANEMKTRLEKKVGDEASAIWAGTFHSVCVKLLRMFGERIGYGDGFTIYDADDSKKLIISVIKDMGGDDKMFQPKTVQNFISRAKDRLLTPHDVELESKDFREKKMAEFYREYQRRLVSSNAVDFDDIIMQTVRLLREDSDALDYCQRKFKYVCVDEYQDTNHAQFVLTSLISEKHRNLMVVGDDDQSIYRFRGADIENILNFDREISDAKVVKLEQNYRSTKSILDLANVIIKENTNRHGKNLWTAGEDGSPVSLRRLDTQNDESRYIVDKILELKRTEGRSLSDFAVLYRVNALSNTLEGAFMRSGVPYRVLGGLRFHERKEIKDILAYLCVINNPSDNIRLMRIINEPKRKIGENTVSAVYELANREGCSMFDIMKRADGYVAISKAAAKLKEFVNLICGLKEIADIEPLDVLIDKVLELTGYRAMLRAQDEAEGKSRLENAEELISSAVEFTNTHEDATLSSFLEEMALVADIDNYDPDAEAVVLMTIHSAKGLEFPVVFLPALEEGIFPGQQAMYEQVELEEERRLAYVAVTRAKQRLFLTHTRERLMYGRTSYNKLSPFFAKVPDSMLDVEKPQERPRYSAGGGFVPRGTAPSRPAPTFSSEFTRKPNAGMPTHKSVGVSFGIGDAVNHPVFGNGIIMSVTKMGTDVLYEIVFDNVGTKKMMGSYAKIKKV